MDAKDYVVKSLKDGSLQDELRGPGPSRQLAAQHVRLALQHPGLQGKGHEYFLKHLLGTSTACRARTWAATKPSPKKCSGTTRRPKASWTCWSRWTSA
jgi:nitrate reductase alpha subunit